MSVYKFKFQKILEYRKSIEDQKKNILSIQIKKYTDEKDALDELYHSLQQRCEDLDIQVINGVAIDKLRIMSQQQEFLREGIKKRTISVIKAEDDVEKSRYELMRAMQSKKVLERLNNIYFSEFKYDEQRKYEKQIEEIVSFKEIEK